MVDEFLHRLGRRGVWNEHVKRKAEQMRDRRKVDKGIVVELAVKAWRDCHRGCGVQDGVSVGIGLRDHLRRGVGAAARAVFDHDLVPPHPRQRLRHQAGGDIGRPAGRQRHDQPDEAARESDLLRAGDHCGG
jgi:hypothetical protein